MMAMVLVVLDEENDDNGTCQWEYGWYLSSWMTRMMAMVLVVLDDDNDGNGGNDDNSTCWPGQ